MLIESIRTPIGAFGTKFCVLTLKDGREHKSPWYYRYENADKALELMRKRYGRAIIYVD